MPRHQHLLELLLGKASRQGCHPPARHGRERDLNPFVAVPLRAQRSAQRAQRRADGLQRPRREAVPHRRDELHHIGRAEACGIQGSLPEGEPQEWPENLLVALQSPFTQTPYSSLILLVRLDKESSVQES